VTIPLSAPPVALTLSGGVWIVMGVFALGFIAVIFGYFTERGTEIRFHAWGDHRGDAPGSLGVGNVGKDPTVDVRAWTRGTSARRRRNVPSRATTPKARTGDPDLLVPPVRRRRESSVRCASASGMSCLLSYATSRSSMRTQWG